MDAAVLARVALAVLVAAVAGCASDPVSPAAGPCLALKPHFPQKLRPADTADTKVDGYRRNAVFEAVCPDAPKKTGWLG